MIIMATKEVDFYNNKVENHKTVNASIVSYEVFTSEKKEREQKKEELKALSNGLRAVDQDYNVKTDNTMPTLAGYLFMTIVLKTNILFPAHRQ